MQELSDMELLRSQHQADQEELASAKDQQQELENALTRYTLTPNICDYLDLEGTNKRLLR